MNNHSPNPAYSSPAGERLLRYMCSPKGLCIDTLAMNGKSVRECIALGYPFPPGVPLDFIVLKTGHNSYELRDPNNEHRVY